LSASTTTRPMLVEAPARLHFGVLDLRGELGRRFGGIGAAIPVPSLLLEGAPAARFTIEGSGPDVDRARQFARRFAAHYRIELRARLTLRRTIPAHVGLGSGTQLALAVARVLAELHGIDADTTQLARAVDRGRRSGVGTWTFALGGFVLEGGRRADSDGVAPLLARLPIPQPWRCVLVVPEGAPGLVGDEEARAFAELPPPCRGEVERVAHLVLMQLLPALAEADLPGFGAALTEIQRITGGWFSAAQGGVYAPGPSAELIGALERGGALGVGQSSWGPAVYGLTPDPASAQILAARVRTALGRTPGAVYETGFSHTGATILPS